MQAELRFALCKSPFERPFAIWGQLFNLSSSFQLGASSSATMADKSRDHVEASTHKKASCKSKHGSKASQLSSAELKDMKCRQKALEKQFSLVEKSQKQLETVSRSSDQPVSHSSPQGSHQPSPQASLQEATGGLSPSPAPSDSQEFAPARDLSKVSHLFACSSHDENPRANRPAESAEVQLTYLPDNSQLLISKAISTGIAAGIRSHRSTSLVSDYLGKQAHSSPQASLTEPSHHCHSPSEGSVDLVSGEEPQRDLDLSEDEDSDLPDTPAFTGLFPVGLFKSLIHKVIITAGLQEEGSSEQVTAEGQGHGIFSEPVLKQLFIPAPKLFGDVFQNQWANPATLPTPSSSNKKIYNMAPIFNQLL